MITLRSLPLSLGIVVVSTLLVRTAHGAICRTDYPVEGCGLITFDNRTCDWVLDNYAMIQGSCCSLSDYGTGGCRLTVDGPNSDCQVRMVGEFYPEMMVISETNNGTCPPTQYTPQPQSQCRAPNATCGMPFDGCCDGTVCRQKINSGDTTTRCLACRKMNKPCLETTDCCKGRCRRISGTKSSTKTCRTCVKLNDKPCLDDGDCCNAKATCVASGATGGGKVCKL